MSYASPSSIEHPPPAGGGPDILDVVYSLLARRRRIVIFIVVGLAIGLGLALGLPKEYTATARVLPPQPESSTSSLLVGSLGGLGALSGLSGGGLSGGGVGAALGLKNPSDLYVGLLKSTTVADRLISQFHLNQVYRQRYASRTRKELARHTTFTEEKEGLISIAVTSKSPERAAAMANAYVAALNTEDEHLSLNIATSRANFLQGQLEQEKTALANAEVALKATEEQSGLVQLNGQAQLLIERIAQVRAQIAAHQVQLEALSGSETPQNPEYQRVQAELGALQSQLQQLQKSSPQTQPGSDGDLVSSSLPAVGLAYVRKLRDVKYHETLFELLARQYAAARMDQARSSPEVQVVDPATAPDHKSAPPRALLIVGFTLLGLLVGCAQVLMSALLATWLEMNGRREKYERIRGLFKRDVRQEHA